ncbi:MAG: NAD(P)/FAD-dependent oxidoreductase [Blastocatellales bacterium]|nr:NAD(P)/FAD-dependent oxidoreductase [Blastocatellales bacterium]
MRVAVIGAGPAGAHLAYLLGKEGAEVLLFDARDAWEKPCGGGVTTKAMREFPFLAASDAPKQMVSSLRLTTGAGRSLRLRPRGDFAVYSRAALGRSMRQRAVDAGARLHSTRVGKTRYGNSGWEIETAAGIYTADFLVGADGASSVIRRRMGVHFGLNDFSYALGWHVKPRENGYETRNPHEPAAGHGQVDIKYLPDFTGYLWAFPRTDHLSYGIATKYRETTPADLKARLLDFIALSDSLTAEEIRTADHHTTRRAAFYGAMIPALETATWDGLKVAGRSWALIGDAAGFVDPLTGEGIYYAIKSAELLADALKTDIEEYDDRWRAEFGAELRRASQLQQRFYRSEFAGAPLVERMVQFARWHGGVRRTLRDLIAGEQGYVDLKGTLKRRIWAVV